MRSSALLRICSMPVAVYLQGGNPDLFARCGNFDSDSAALEAEGSSLSDELQTLINADPLERMETKRLGAVASRLARLAGLRDVDRNAITTILSQRSPPLAARILAHGRSRAILADLRRQLEEDAANESERAAHALWSACRKRPETITLLRHRDPDFLTRCIIEGHNRDHWRKKKGRCRAQHLSGILERACFRTVPRDWHTYVSLVPVASSDNDAADLMLEGAFAEVWTENIHTLRKALSERWTSMSKDATLSVTQMCWHAGDRIYAYVTDAEVPSKVNEVELRASRFLEKLLSALGEKSLGFDDVRSRLVNVLEPDEFEVLGGFVAHLIKLGVIQVSCPPDSRIGGWTSEIVATPPDTNAAKTSQAAGYLDVYARCRGSLPGPSAEALQAGFSTISRLATIIELDSRAARTASVSRHMHTSELDVGLLETVCVHLRTAARGEAFGSTESDPSRSVALNEIETTATPLKTTPTDWPPPSDLASPYGRLIQQIAPLLGSAECITIAESDLDEVGAPPWRYRWPYDAMIRFAARNTDYIGVFDEAFPAGSMDARFVSAARGLGLETRQHDWYRAFLDTLRKHTDQVFVELLFPPLSVGAANAVRRPPYVPCWTGDPAASAYYTPMPSELTYLPLERITIRHTERGERLFADGRPVFPLYHATRLPIAPWTILTERFLNAAPFYTRWAPRRLHRILDAFPDAERAPRLVVGDGLVLSCAQWRLPRDVGLREGDHIVDRMSSVIRLMRRLALPRLVFLSPGSGHRPVPCDLQSLAGMNALEMVLSTGPDPFAIEMTPATGISVPREPSGFGHISCGMLRFPADIAPDAFAEKVGLEFA